VAEWFGRSGHPTVLVARTAAEVENAAAEIRATGGEALPFTGDVSDPAVVSALFQTTREAFGRVSVLINNAAVVEPVGLTWDTSLAEWEYAFRANFTSALLCSRLAVADMIPSGSGRIINVVSGLAERPMARFSAYSVSKAALLHLTRIMALEVRGLGITVNAVSPGVVNTRMQEQLRSMPIEKIGREAHDLFNKVYHRGMLKAPSDIARLIGFLASSETEEINGEVGDEAHYRNFGYSP